MSHLKVIVKMLAVLGLFMAMACTAIASTKNENKEGQQQFVELLPKDFKPAFSRETVIKLNAIVRRSYDVINEYDAIIERTYNNVMQASKSELNQQHQADTKQQILVIRNLEHRSNLALSDMMSAVEILKKSGEEHNKAILAGMVNFVKDVNKEVSKKNAEINQLLNDA
jgi:uncharacterized membrane protein